MITDRKEDTRKKIQLGGLVKKANLENESTAVLLGLMLDAYEKLQGDKAEIYRAEWRIKGDIALTIEK